MFILNSKGRGFSAAPKIMIGLHITDAFAFVTCL
jgi:hypothetical protein